MEDCGWFVCVHVLANKVDFTLFERGVQRSRTLLETDPGGGRTFMLEIRLHL